MVIKTIDDYVDAVHKKFNNVPREYVERVLKFGAKSFYTHNLYGLDILMKSRYFTLYCGKFFRNPMVFYEYWKIKNRIKLRLKYKRSKQKFTGVYYFGLTENQYEEYMEQLKKGKRRRRKFMFVNFVAYKLLDELLLDHAKHYIFSLDYDLDVGFTFYQKEFITRSFKFMYSVNPNPKTTTQKQYQ